MAASVNRSGRFAARLRAFVAAGTAAAAAFLAAPAAHADVDVELRLGHGGAWIQDAATPLVVELTGRGKETVQVRIEVRGNDFTGRDEVVHERTVVVAGNVTRREVFLVPGGDAYGSGARVTVRTSPAVPVRSRTKTGDKGRLELSLSSAGGNEGRAAPYEGHVFGVWNDRRNTLGTKLPEAARLNSLGVGVEDADRIHVVQVAPEALALGPLGLDGIEILVVCDPDASFAADPREAEAILDWVALGGRLVVALGENAAQFPASPLAAEMPARWRGADAGDAARIADALGVPSAALGATRPAALVRLEPDERAKETLVGLPDDLVAVRRFGSGRIAVLGFDLRAVLEILPREREAVRPLLDALPFEEAEHAKRVPGQTWDNTFDVTRELGTMLQGTAFQPPPLPLVILGLVAYVLVVGPLDWFVLRRLKKERWTTFTFAGSVLAFTVVAYGISLLLFSADAVVNRVTFVQFAPGGREGREVVRIRDLAGHYAPLAAVRTHSYSLPAAVVGSTLPGVLESGGVGAKHPIVVRGTDPTAPVATLDIAFRSQRVVSSLLAGTTGRTLDVVARTGRSDMIQVEVENGLPCDFLGGHLIDPQGREVVLGRVRAGSRETWTAKFVRPTHVVSMRWHGEERQDVATAREFLTRIVAAASRPGERPYGFHALRRAGIVAPRASRGHATLLGFTDGPPVPLPGDDLGGTRHFVVTKEVELR